MEASIAKVVIYEPFVKVKLVSLVLVPRELHKPLRGWRADYSQTRSPEQSRHSARVPKP